MSIRLPVRVLARMPSTRSQPLNPRVAAMMPAVVRAASAPPRPTRQAEADLPARAEDAACGGFHESSYELRNGLEVNESEWPPDSTIPGLLGPR